MSEIGKITPEEASRVIRKLIMEQHISTAGKYLGGGVAVGAAGAGLLALAKQLGRQSNPTRSTYTKPILTSIYAKEEPATKKAQVDGNSDVATLAANDKYSLAAKLLGLAAGVPVGAMLVNSIGRRVKQRSQDLHLKKLYGEYERALQDYAGSGIPSKKASVAPTEMQQLVEKLAQIEADHSLSNQLAKYIMAWTAITPVIGAVAGFRSGRESGKQKAFEAAELKLQADRENRFPTNSVVMVKDVPGKRKKNADEIREQLEREALRRVDTSYLE